MNRRICSCIRTDREGQTLALVAVMLVALLAMLALAIDLGMAYTARAEAQRVADAAALAGASAFLTVVHPHEAEEDAYELAFQYAGLNSVRNKAVDVALVSGEGNFRSSSDVTVQVLIAEEKVRVWVSRTGLPTWFARVLGRHEMQVGAMAAAQAMAASTSPCIMPFAIPDLWDERTGDDHDNNRTMDFDRYWKNNCHNRPSGGPQSCSEFEKGEWWEYHPEGTVAEGLYDEYRIDRDILSWDGSKIIQAANGTAITATGIGSAWRDTNSDNGMRVLLKPPHLSGSDDSKQLDNWWQYWHPVGASRSQSALNDMIRDGECWDLTEHDGGIGEDIIAEGISNTPGARASAYRAVTDRIDRAEPQLRWDEMGNYPYDPNAPLALDGSRIPVYSGRQVITVPLVHPEVLLRKRGDKGALAIIEIVTLFLEDPRLPPFDGKVQGSDISAPVSGRIMHRGTGAPGGPNVGKHEKYLRLVE
jgi:Flp pilus assembly protein TadG